MFEHIGPWEVLFISFISMLSLAGYCLPTFICMARRTKKSIGIVLLNILAGWTFIGWIVALVWSIMDDRKREPLKS